MTKIFSILNVTPWSWNSLGAKIMSGSEDSISDAASLAYPTADLAIYIPFMLQHSMELGTIFLANGATVSGNIDFGIYDATGRKIIAAGSTAQAGTNDLQTLDPSGLVLGPGQYFFAVSADNTTATMTAGTVAVAITTPIINAMGIYNEASAFPLPDTATFAAPSANYIPIVGISPRSLI